MFFWFNVEGWKIEEDLSLGIHLESFWLLRCCGLQINLGMVSLCVLSLRLIFEIYDENLSDHVHICPEQPYLEWNVLSPSSSSQNSCVKNILNLQDKQRALCVCVCAFIIREPTRMSLQFLSKNDSILWLSKYWVLCVCVCLRKLYKEYKCPGDICPNNI